MLKSICLAVIAAMFVPILTTAQNSDVVVSLPIIQVQQTVKTEIVTLTSTDTTYISAAMSPYGCNIVAYINRGQGNRLHVARDAGNHLIDIELPPEMRLILDRTFIAPGDKQADVSLLVDAVKLTLYYSTRDENDPNGIFRLKRLTMASPSCI